MSKSCPKCGADYNGRPAPNQHDYWCGSTTWGEGDFYQSPECVRRERDQLVERIKRLEDVLEKAELAVAFANREHGVIRMMADDYTEVLQQIRVALKAKEAKP